MILVKSVLAISVERASELRALMNALSTVIKSLSGISGT